ncbi:MAG: hypothetical protein Q9162_001799 [Coniocarpon cinnabarinum]
MSFLKKSDNTSLSTPLPASTPAPTILSVLHNHTFLLALDSTAESSTIISGNQDYSAEYDVTAKKPIGKTTYQLRIDGSINDGVDLEVTAHPPTGEFDFSFPWRWYLDVALNPDESIAALGRDRLQGQMKTSEARQVLDWQRRRQKAFSGLLETRLTVTGTMKIWSKIRVTKGSKGWELNEEVKIQGNRMIVGFVRSNVEVEHKAWHSKIVEEAERREKKGDASEKGVVETVGTTGGVAA